MSIIFPNTHITIKIFSHKATCQWCWYAYLPRELSSSLTCHFSSRYTNLLSVNMYVLLSNIQHSVWANSQIYIVLYWMKNATLSRLISGSSSTPQQERSKISPDSVQLFITFTYLSSTSPVNLLTHTHHTSITTTITYITFLHHTCEPPSLTRLSYPSSPSLSFFHSTCQPSWFIPFHIYHQQVTSQGEDGCTGTSKHENVKTVVYIMQLCIIVFVRLQCLG